MQQENEELEEQQHCLKCAILISISMNHIICAYYLNLCMNRKKCQPLNCINCLTIAYITDSVIMVSLHTQRGNDFKGEYIIIS